MVANDRERENAEISVEVDGQVAKLKNMPADPQPVAATRVEGPPRIRDWGLTVALQIAFDKGEIAAIKQPLSKAITCEARRMDDGDVVGCSARAAFEFEEPHKCESCGKSAPRKHHKLCIADMALMLAGDLKDLQTDLFEHVGAE